MQRFGKSWIFWATISLLAGISLLLWVTKTPKLYRATTILELIPPKPFAFSAANAKIRSSNPDLNTYLRMLNSRRIAAEVIASYTTDEVLHLLTTPESNSVESPLGEIRFDAQRNEPVGILIQVRHQNPKAAEIISNRYATEFIRFLDSLEASSRNEAVAQLKARLAELELQLSIAQATCQKVSLSNDLRKLREAENQLAIVQVQIQLIHQRIEEAEAEPLEERPFRIASPTAKAEPIDWWNR